MLVSFRVAAAHVHPGQARRGRAILAVVALLASLFAVVVFRAPQADAAPVKAFTPVFTTQDNGQIGMFGNSVMTCPTAATGCTAARSATPRTTAVDGINNNDFVMGYVNADTSMTGLINSSSSDVVLPNQATVLFAGLYWGGRTTAGGSSGTATTLPKNSMKLRVAGATSYVSIPADTTYDAGDGTTYASYADVTTRVKAAGAGTYWGADVAASTGVDRFGGWSLIVVYRQASLPLRDLTVNNGYEYIAANSAGDSFTFGGFLTPPDGTVRTRVGVVAWEGDDGYVGDSMSLNTTALSSTISPATNFFDSSNDLLGSNVTTRNPKDANQFGVDIKDIAAPDALPNNARSATVSLKTNGDAYYPQAITTTVDLYAPNFSSLVKTVKNLSGNSPAARGDTLQYTLSFTNSGDDAADNSVVRDPLPTGLTYVPGSIRVTAGANAGAKTDQTGDDQANYDTANRQVVVRVGTGADEAKGGTLAAQEDAPDNTTTVTFQAKIDRAAPSTVSNTAVLDYTAHTINKNYTFTGNTVSTAVSDLADLAVAGSVAPSPASAGNAVTYTFDVTNPTGPNAGAGAVLTTTIPAELTGVTATGPGGTCTVNGTTVTCPLGTIPAGTTGTQYRVQIRGTIPSGSNSTSLSATAMVSATTADDNNSNNIATVSTQVARNADLTVTHTGTPATVIPGNQATYTITVTNKGPSDATGTVLTDTLPTGLNFTSATGTNGVTCTQNNGVITCPMNTLAPNAVRTVTVVATVDPSFTGTSVTPSASVISTTTDPTPADNQASARTDVAAPSADLQITGTASPGAPDYGTPGANSQFAFTVTNNGPSTATGVTATLPVPAGTDFVGVTSRTGSCTYDEQANTVTCQLGTIPTAGTTAILLQTKVRSNQINAVTATASVQSSVTADPRLANNSTQVTQPQNRRADLGVTVTGTATELTSGETETYTITAYNHGPSDATDVRVSNPIPANTTFVSATPEVGTYDPATGIWTIGSLALDGSVTLTLTVRADASTDANTTITDTATISTTATPAITDPNAANNTASFEASTDTVADLQVTGAVAPNPVVAGNTTTVTYTITNAGPSDATDSEFTYTVPAGASFVPNANTNCTLVPGTNGNPDTVTCSLGTIAPNTSRTVPIDVRVAPGTAAGPLTNSGSVTTGTRDPSAANNRTDVIATVTTQADIGVTQTLSSNSVFAGQSVTDTVVITNYGPSNAASTRVKITPPMGVTLGVPPNLPAGVTCTLPGGVLTCVLGNLAPSAAGNDQSLTLSFPASVNPSAPAATYRLDAQGSTTTPEPDTDPHADAASADLTVATRADLAVTTSVSPQPAVPGQTVTQKVTVTDLGESDAQAGTVVIRIPAGTTVVSAVSDQGSCTTDVGAGTITCTLGTVSPGTPLNVYATFLVAPSRTTALDFRADVSSTTTDPNPTNNRADVTNVAVAPSADVAVVSTISGEAVRTVGGVTHVPAGSAMTYNFTVSNKGPSDAVNLTLDGTLPAGVSAMALHTPAGVSCRPNPANPQQISCTVASLPSGTSLTGSLDVSVSAALDEDTSLVNNVTLTSGTPDPNTANNTSGTVAVVDTAAVLSIRQQSNPSTSVVPGAPYTYRIAVGNSGPSDARSVTLTDTLPAGITFTDGGANNTPFSTSQGSCTANADGHSFSCDLGTIGSGVVTVTVAGVVLDPASTLASVNNHVVASSPTPATPDGTTPQQVTSDLAKVVTPAAAVELTKAAATTVSAGERITWTVTAFNNMGPSDVHNLVVTDDLSGDPDYRPASPDTNTPAVIPAGMPVLTGVTATYNGTDCATTQSPDRFTSVSCPVGTLAVGATATITISAVVSAGYTKASIVNTAHMYTTATGAQPAAFLSNGPDSNTSTVGVSASHDLGVAVNAVDNPMTPGAKNSYTVTVANKGPSDAAGTVVSIPVPDGFGALTVTNAAGDPVACTTDAGVLKCPVGTVAANGTPLVLTVAGTLDAARTADVTIAASVPTADDPIKTDNTASKAVPVLPSADLVVTKKVDPSTPVVAGGTFNYLVSVTNNKGPSVAHAITVSDTLQDGVTPSSQATVVDGAACTVTGQQVSCPIASLAVGDTATVKIPVTMASSFDAAQYANQATATMKSDQDPNGNNNVGQVGGVAAKDADLTPTVTAEPESPGRPAPTPQAGPNRVVRPAAAPAATTNAVAIPGKRVTYPVVVTNNGPSDAVRPSVRIDLGADETLVGTVTAPTGWTCTGTGPITCSLTSTTVTTLAAKARANFSLVAAVDPAATADQTVTATVSSAGTVDSVTDNNVSTVDVTLEPRADLAVTKTVDPTAPVAGQDATYTVKVVNNGPSTATRIAVTDAIQDGQQIQGTPTVDGRDCTVTGQTVECAVATLAPTATATVTVTVHLPASFDPATFTNSATATSDVLDTDTTNNTGQVSGGAAAQADLQVTKTASAPVVAGGSVTWTVRVRNAGPSDATGVVVSDPLPGEATPTSVSLTGDGENGQCTSGSTVRCEIDRLPAGGTATVTIAALVASGATGTLTNAASATAADQTDPDPGNNTSQVSSDLGTATSLELTKTVTPKAVVAGEDATYTITATNTGISDAVDVAVNDPLADGLQYRSVRTDPAGTPCSQDDGVTCTFERIKPKQTVRMVVVVHIADDFDDPTVTNTASATSPSVPPTAPPTTTVTSPVVGVSTIDVTKTVDHPNAAVGDRVTFTVVARNVGTAEVSPVLIDDRPPASMHIESVTVSSGRYDTRSAQWTIPALAVRASATLHMTVTLTASGEQVNVARVDPATPGVSASGADSARAGVNVAGGGGLAYTGVAVLNNVLVAVLLLGLGGGLVIIGRRRRLARHRA